MKKSLVISLILVFACAALSGIQAKPDGGRIQIAILLDTSNSMDGLINQAKSQLWKIINEVAAAKKNGVTPRLEVALFEYGNDRIPAGEGHIRMITPFTKDLDRVSEELFALTTLGGNEYCGAVIKNAVSNLQWSGDPSDLKLIFIAGNEPFTQGAVDYHASAKIAMKKGIVVNTIYCGGYEEGIMGKWKDGADFAGGKYLHIDHNQQMEQIASPVDPEIMSLNQQLNDTYVAYGTEGNKKKERQKIQDKKAGAMGAASEVDRSISKSTKAYANDDWDLVDYAKDGRKDITALEEKELPGEMRKMSPAQRKEYVQKLAAKRAKIQERLRVLGAEREKFLKAERARRGEKNTLDRAMTRTIREQAEKKSYDFR